MSEERGYRYAVEAEEWVERNRDAWNAIVVKALECTAQCRRFGMKKLCEDARYDMVLKDGIPFKLNNNYTSWLARKLVKEHPEVEPYIKRRKSMGDGVEL